MLELLGFPTPQSPSVTAPLIGELLGRVPLFVSKINSNSAKYIESISTNKNRRGDSSAVDGFSITAGK